MQGDLPGRAQRQQPRRSGNGGCKAAQLRHGGEAVGGSACSGPSGGTPRESCSTAHVVCCSSSHHAHRRLDLGLSRRALARRRCSQHDHRALHGAAAARVRVCQSLVSRGTGGRQETQSSTGPRLPLPHRRRVSAVRTRQSAHPAPRARARGDRAAPAATGALATIGACPRGPCPPPLTEPLPR